MTLTEARHILNNGIKPSANLICMAQGFLEGHKAALESASKIARNYPCYNKTLPCGTEIASMILGAKSESDGGN